MLLEKGFDDADITILVDDDDTYDPPNRHNVMAALRDLCTDREPGDIIFMHYSGHGTQIPSDGDDEETDDKDEAIVLGDMYTMADDDLKQYFCRLPDGARATVVMDCCHSGSMLDGQEVIISGDKEDDERDLELPEGLREPVEADAGDRSLPLDILCNVLGQKIGADVAPSGNGVNGAMAQLFGGSAGKLARRYALNQLTGQASGGAGADLGALAVDILTRGDVDTGDVTEEEISERPSRFISSMMAQLGLGGEADEDEPYNPDHEEMSEAVVTLVTGCQADETSADVRPEDGEPHGALTKAYTDVLCENADVTSYELVREVRSVLADQGFSQNPCLETSDELSSEVFICE